MSTFIEYAGLAAAVAMPLWNIPLIVRIIRRKTSADISVAWLFGVWVCILLMLPATLRSKDLAFKAYGIMNAALFSLVVVVVMAYRKKEPPDPAR